MILVCDHKAKKLGLVVFLRYQPLKRFRGRWVHIAIRFQDATAKQLNLSARFF